MTAAKKIYLTQWQVDSYRVSVEGVKGNLAKPQAVQRELIGGLKKKSEEGGNIAQSPDWIPQQDKNRESSILDRSCRW